MCEISDGQQHSLRVSRKRQESKQGIFAAALDVAREDGRDEGGGFRSRPRTSNTHPDQTLAEERKDP